MLYLILMEHDDEKDELLARGVRARSHTVVVVVIDIF